MRNGTLKGRRIGTVENRVSTPCAVAIIPCSCLENEETVSGVQTRELLRLGSLYSTTWTIIDYLRYLVSDC